MKIELDAMERQIIATALHEYKISINESIDILKATTEPWKEPDLECFYGIKAILIKLIEKFN